MRMKAYTTGGPTLADKELLITDKPGLDADSVGILHLFSGLLKVIYFRQKKNWCQKNQAFLIIPAIHSLPSKTGL